MMLLTTGPRFLYIFCMTYNYIHVVWFISNASVDVFPQRGAGQGYPGGFNNKNVPTLQNLTDHWKTGMGF